MSYSDGLRRLAAVVEALEDSGADIVSARPERPDGDDVFRVELRVDLPLDEPLSGGVFDGTARGSGGNDQPPAESVDGAVGAGESNGDDVERGERTGSGEPADAAAGLTRGAGIPAPGGPSTGSDASDVGDADGRADTDGVACRAPDCERVFGSEHGMKIHFTKMHGAETPGEARAAPYRDPERLRAAYEATASFAAMRDELGVDVSPETVRRYAVQYGIHERGTGLSPSGSGDGNDAEDEGAGPVPPAPAVTTATGLTPAVRRARDEDGDGSEDAHDGRSGPVALPGELTLADLKETVRTSHTLRQAARSLGLDRDRTAELLDELDLLDLVHGRVATKERRDELKANIDDRLRDGRAGPSLST